ncbi:unnamed protein product [Schistosoma margrebowiei]|uniref:Uncharacterized protein n=1 Tax=Schistosoma margrebowiei TaxID=48269 RepID=A0A183MGR6_9TREM|nr:unnamed protein product [Schistosoma margrebowiei]
MPRQFYCIGRKRGELRKPSSRRYKYLLISACEKYFESFGQNSRQQPTMGGNKSNPSGGRNQKEALEVNRIHIEESTQLRHKTSPHLESSKSKEKRKTKEHITPRNGDRHENNEH